MKRLMFGMASGVVANVSVTLGNNAKLLMPQGGGGGYASSAVTVARGA